MLSLYEIFAQVATPTPGANTPPASQEQIDSGLLYVVAAYAAIWLLIFAWLYIMNRRQSNLQRQIAILKQEASKQLQD